MSGGERVESWILGAFPSTCLWARTLRLCRPLPNAAGPAAMMGRPWLSFTQAPSGYIVPNPHAMADAGAAKGRSLTRRGLRGAGRKIVPIIRLSGLGIGTQSSVPHIPA